MMSDDITSNGHGFEGESGAADPVNQSRLVGKMLDGLIRSCRAESPATASIAGRLLERWKANPDILLKFDATSLIADDMEVLSAEEDEGRWLLPAFMAGLKSICLGAAPAEEDLVLLASELGALGPSLASIRRFRDWLWSEGAEGFDIVLDFGFTEGLDAALMDVREHKEMLAAMRAEAASSLSLNAARIASRELDIAAARDEFQVPLDTFTETAAAGGFAQEQEAAERLKRRCEDSVFWIDAQVFLALAHPELRAQMPAQRLARRVLTMLKEGATLRFVGFLAELKRRREAYAQELLAALEDEPIGRTLAENTALDEHAVRALADLLATPPSSITRDLAMHLVERLTGDQASLQSLAQLMMTTGFGVFWAHVDTAALSERSVTVLGKLLLACKAPEGLLADLVKDSPPAVALRLATGFPPEMLWALRQTVCKLLGDARPNEAHALLRVLFSDTRFDWANVLGNTVVASNGEALALPVLRTVCSIITKKGLCKQYLVPLVRAKEAKEEVRLTALRFVEQDPNALAEASQWRFRELFVSKELRERLKRARKKPQGDE